jgi:hypothetical protein
MSFLLGVTFSVREAGEAASMRRGMKLTGKAAKHPPPARDAQLDAKQVQKWNVHLFCITIIGCNCHFDASHSDV